MNTTISCKDFITVLETLINLTIFIYQTIQVYKVQQNFVNDSSNINSQING